ncbi:hypothetical protein DEO72_LG6g1052 [Vigna unguiculata]|uniref:Uncharacterized protein n=1 Tax=Vigna unguiculata TaxID=3917 RepID=A0A4D6M6P3_VIGUN|nr:hypothetical protein DEO72_LG6g1052 [Vigna unguiculata]
MSTSASSSDGLLGGAVGTSGGGGSISSLFSSSDSGTSLEGVSSATDSPILLSGSSEVEPPIVEAVEHVAASDESGDIIGIASATRGNKPTCRRYQDMTGPLMSRAHMRQGSDGVTTLGI